MFKKITAIALTLALALSVVAMPASVGAQTAAELQAQILELQALIAALQAQLSTPAPAVGVPAACVHNVTFSRNLSLGMTGGDVKCLQALLNADPATRVASLGVGSQGQETEYFGALTRTAVVAFQNKYASEVLHPIGLTAGTGFVGAQTKNKLNLILQAMLVAPAPTDPTAPAPTQPGDVVVSEGDLEVKLLGVPNNVEVAAGAQNAGVMSFELTAKDSDITIRRMDVHSDGTVERPGKNLSQVSLYDGNNLLLGVNANDYTRPTGQTYFSYRYNLNLVIPKGTTKTINVRVSALDTVTNADSYRFTIPVDGIRFTDTAGLSHTTPAAVVQRAFSMSTTAAGLLANTVALDNPAEGIVIGNETANTTGVEMLKFNTKATQNSVVIDRVVVQATTTGTSTASSLINAIHLYDGTTLVGTETIGSGLATTTFSNLGITVAKDATKTFTVRIDLNKVDGVNATSGDTVVVGIASMIGEDSLFNTVTATGVITSETQYVYLAGPRLTLDSATITPVLNASNQTTHGDGTITFRVTALGKDIVIPTTGATATAATTTAAATTTITGQEYLIDGVLLSSATELQRTITAGSSRIITAKARVSATAGARVRLEITGLSWTVGGTFNAPASLFHNLVTPSVIIGA